MKLLLLRLRYLAAETFFFQCSSLHLAFVSTAVKYGRIPKKIKAQLIAEKIAEQERLVFDL